MSLQEWAADGWLRSHQSTRQEIAGLLSIVDRDLADAEAGISNDWRFGIAYNAALKLCTILLLASGYRAERTMSHYRTIAAMPLILGEGRKDDAAYLDACRVKRNIVEYDMAGATTESDASELVKFSRELREEVLHWLREHHPELAPGARR
jgi:hypothetical protein